MEMDAVWRWVVQPSTSYLQFWDPLQFHLHSTIFLLTRRFLEASSFLSQFSSTPLHSTPLHSTQPLKQVTTCTSHKTIRVVVLKKKTAKETPSQLKTKHRRSACSFSFMTGREAPPIHQINYVQLLHLVV